MAFGALVTSATTSISFPSIPAGATIVVFPQDSNGNGTAFGVSDGDGAYTAFGSIQGAVGDTATQGFILTGASAGTHTINMTCTGDTVFSGVAVYYTGVGGLDNSGAAFNGNELTMTATANNGSSGNFTTTTANAIVCGFALNLLTTAQPTVGTSVAFTSEGNGTLGGTNGYRFEDFTLATPGTAAATFQYASGSHPTAIIGFALAPSGGGGSNTTITPTVGADNFTGNTPTVTPATNSVVVPFTARKGGFLEPDRRLLIPKERKIFLPSRGILKAA